MTQTFQNYKEAEAWQQRHDSLAPKRGDEAPDFQLRDVNGQNPVRLSNFKDRKPVALIFGSFTWPPFVREAVSLRDLYAQYNEQVQFLTIYIREAHPLDGWDVGSENRIYDPKTLAERQKVAGMCEVAMQYGIRTYVDEMDDAVMTVYAAWPERLYLVGVDGRIAYAGGLGPFGFKPADLKAAIDTLLGDG